MTYEITIPGEPVAKGRPRFTKTGRAYTPQKTGNYEARVVGVFMKKYGRPIFCGGFEAAITAYFEVPKSRSKAVKEAMLAGKIRPLKKPDGDNIIKIVLDALNNVAYKDDKQAVCIRFEKYYSDTPRIEARITEMA